MDYGLPSAIFEESEYFCLNKHNFESLKAFIKSLSLRNRFVAFSFLNKEYMFMGL